MRTAASLATGDYLLIFDADLEYSADDMLSLLTPVLRGRFLVPDCKSAGECCAGDRTALSAENLERATKELYPGVAEGAQP